MLMDFEIESGRAVAIEQFDAVSIRAELEQHCDSQQTHEVRNFELPAAVWTAMFASYAAFFAGLIVATGRDGSALFAIVISVLYAVMFFGTAAILNSVNRAARPTDSSLARGKGIETATGWMSNTTAYAQILTVPVLMGFFACAIAIIRASV